jgi:hypothetical protein
MLQENVAVVPQVVAEVPRLLIWGAGAFGAVIGWYIYFINRYRKDDVTLSDIVTLIGAIGGAAILNLFDRGSVLFGAYGIGLAIGFFLYFFVLIILVGVSKNFDADYFLDGRRRWPVAGYEIPVTFIEASRGMGKVSPGSGGNP